MQTVTMQYFPKSKFRPNYFAEEVKEWVWFIYPWNWIEDTTTLIVRLMSMKTGKSWSLLMINEGLSEYFEINWDKTMLLQILQVMVEREQITSLKKEQKIHYELKQKKVIQL